ncbi:MAG: hypothetical protein H8E27_08210 [Verrucomicrobia subdivision 3 bacterium]|nr:hypothetical protein [Limisphaerales bacterium]
MKQIIAILVATFVGAAATFILKSPAATSAGFDAEKEKLKEQIARLRGELKNTDAQGNRITTVETEKVITVTARIQPEEILEELKTMRPGDENRQQTMRRVIHYMVGLTDAGEAAFPAIKAFLLQENPVDIEYESNAIAFDREQAAAAAAKAKGEDATQGRISGFVRSGFGTYFMSRELLKQTRQLAPRSLRLGLLDVVADIGGNPAEAILANVLAKTGRGLEVAYLDGLLEKIAGDAYRDQVLETAHLLLKHSPSGDAASLFDETSRAYLFALLVKYRDATFVDIAKTQIITADGRVDGAVVHYLTSVLGEKAVPLLYAKINDKSLTDNGDKMALGDAILKHVGTNADSDKFFAEVITDEKLGTIRFMALGHLMGGDNSEQTLRNRQKLIQSIQADSKDEGLNRMLEGTNNRIEVMLDPTKAGTLNTGGGPAGLLELFNPGNK